MKTRFFPILGLLALTLLSACSSSAASPSAAEAATSTVSPSSAQAIATSRGPALEATDPNTVSLASGQLQLVEFFRFT